MSHSYSNQEVQADIMVIDMENEIGGFQIETVHVHFAHHSVRPTDISIKKKCHFTSVSQWLGKENPHNRPNYFCFVYADSKSH